MRLPMLSTAPPAPAGARRFTNNEWIYVDLGSTTAISRVVLNWGRLRQRLSDPGLQQRDDLDHHLHHHHNNGAIDDLTVSGSGRYVRMFGTARATQWGYSLFEFQVFLSAVAPPALPGAPTGLSAAGVTAPASPSAGPLPTLGPTASSPATSVRDGVQVATRRSSALITGLAANTTYSFTVVAVNSFERP